jgi:hypothetical protein
VTTQPPRARASAESTGEQATSPLAACRGAQLETSWWESNDNAGDTNFGWIVLRDRSSQPCDLRGTLRVVAISDAGMAYGTSVRDPATTPLLLTPNSAAVAAGTLPPTTERVAYLLVATSDSEPDGNTCRKRSSPAEFRIDLPRQHGRVDVAEPRPSTKAGRISLCPGNNLEAGRVSNAP